MSVPRKVLLIKEGIYADLISEGLYFSRIKYILGGVLFDIVVENDEFEIIEIFDNDWKELEE